MTQNRKSLGLPLQKNERINDRKNTRQKQHTNSSKYLIKSVLQMKLWGFRFHWLQFDCYMLVVVQIFPCLINKTMLNDKHYWKECTSYLILVRQSCLDQFLCLLWNWDRPSWHRSRLYRQHFCSVMNALHGYDDEEYDDDYSNKKIWENNKTEQDRG